MHFVNAAAQHVTVVMAACFIVLSQQGLGCPVCTPLPQQTVADQLIAADVVAFGCIDPDQPFSFVVVNVLKGQLIDPHVDLFADSATRHQLAADGSRFVLLVKSSDGWQSLGVVDAKYQQIVRRILTFAPEWERVDGEQKRRFLLEHCALLGIEPAQAMAVGDGANDLPMMGAAGLSVAYCAKPKVRDAARVSINQGGLQRLLHVLL